MRAIDDSGTCCTFELLLLVDTAPDSDDVDAPAATPEVPTVAVLPPALVAGT